MTGLLTPEVAPPRWFGWLRLVRRAVRELVLRLLDLVIAVTVLVIAAPLILGVCLMVRSSSPGSVLFRQVRVGADRREFVMYKFRTMGMDCGTAIHEEYVRQLLAGRVQPQQGLYKLAEDPRITRVGAWLRRSSIDELPQLLNVLRGEMSVVGPRPCLPWEMEGFPEWAASRFDVRPGLTGLWQVSGRNRLTMLDGLRLDVQYVSRRTLGLNLMILLRTVPALLTRGAR